MCSDDKKNLSPQQTKKPPPNKTMWFQTMLLATLSLAEYGKYFLSSLGRCNRSLRLHRPDNLYVRVNSIEGMWLAAFLQKQGTRGGCRGHRLRQTRVRSHRLRCGEVLDGHLDEGRRFSQNKICSVAPKL